MPENLFPLDATKPFHAQERLGHNRWHPDIPPVATVKPGETFRVECRDWFDGAVGNNESAEDVLTAPFHAGHQLSGPFRVAGAEPGDLLVVDIVDVGPTDSARTGSLPGQAWGYTGIFAPGHGGGFLHEHFPDAYKAIWDFQDGRASSRHIPGVSFAGAPHPGVMGTAPSAELLARWNKREAALTARRPLRVPPLALPPLPKGALLGAVPDEDAARLALEAAQTTPPRENGGNQDIKDLTRGSRVFFPVFVEGANLSVGDLHFSQGDGEITLCGAIEMGGYVDLHVDLIPGGMTTYRVDGHAIFVPGSEAPRHEDWISFSGISVTSDDRQRYLDPYLAYQQACLHAVDYLTVFGYSREQAYLLLGAAPIEAHLSSVVDFPNACATLYLPTDIFDFDICPGTTGPHQVSTTDHPPRADASLLPEADVLRAVPKQKRALLPAARRLGGRAARPVSAAFGSLRNLLSRRGA
ncbi:formamidase [Pseudoclavibacter endophyticus]|uniref:Acetamidase/formamidase family protein n=1 Tax=Pseudoclavibacter endophyticus TaxID=1778590 RepID=A0A6H9WP11_9MICO|nr:formamidase [Pseudoclavibacter endophyticus]KAB1648767.1 acetamidase/formamidase family protein [Pseudoclavibacter endophyticus]